MTRRQFILSVMIGVFTEKVFMKSTFPSETIITAELDERENIKITEHRIHCTPTKFNPKREYGRGIELKGMTDQDGIEFLRKDAEIVLPKGTLYDLRMYIRNFNRHYVAAWYYSPNPINLLKYNESPNEWTTNKKNFWIWGCYKMGGFSA